MIYYIKGLKTCLNCGAYDECDRRYGYCKICIKKKGAGDNG